MTTLSTDAARERVATAAYLLHLAKREPDPAKRLAKLEVVKAINDGEALAWFEQNVGDVNDPRR